MVPVSKGFFYGVRGKQASCSPDGSDHCSPRTFDQRTCKCIAGLYGSMVLLIKKNIFFLFGRKRKEDIPGHLTRDKIRKYKNFHFHTSLYTTSFSMRSWYLVGSNRPIQEQRRLLHRFTIVLLGFTTLHSHPSKIFVQTCNWNVKQEFLCRYEIEI